MQKFITLFTSLLLYQFLCAQTPTDTIKLDLTNPTDPIKFIFNSTGEWNKTYDESADYSWFNAQGMNFSHLPSQNSWEGTSWEGFTPSISQDDTLSYDNFIGHTWGCMARGGVKGEGTPFLVAFYSDYYRQTTGESSLQVIFDTLVYPTSVQLCNVPYTYKCITEGQNMARKFGQGDSLTLIIRALNEEYSETTNEIYYHLADYRDNDSTTWTLNNGWEKIDLSGLGQVSGLSFILQSSDQAYGYSNTASYFAMDELSYVKSSLPLSVDQTETMIDIYPNPFTNYIHINSPVVQDITIYNQQGQIVKQFQVNVGETTLNVSSLERGIYLIECNHNIYKLIK